MVEPRQETGGVLSFGGGYMTIHYHGTPLTPRSELWKMAGKSFCVSYAHHNDADICVRIGQSVMWDNGAFSLYTKNKTPKWESFYNWLEPRLGHPHWAVVPDVIDGSIEDNMRLISEWPHPKMLSAVVWHMGEPIDHLLRLVDLGFGKVCFGSSGVFWQVGSEQWSRRADEAFNALASRGLNVWIHMLRGMAVSGKRWPFASVDSVNVARNFKDSDSCPEAMARVIDAVQCPVKWEMQLQQKEMSFDLAV
jgi:hypothetical protein